MILFWRTRHIASIVALFVALSSCAYAQSQQEPKQNSNAAGAQQPAKPDPRGTDALPFIVKIQPAPKTGAEAAEDQRQREQQAFDRWLTQALSVATAIILLFQLVAIGFQVRIAAKQNAIIERQNDLISGQLLETTKAADAAIESNRISREALIADLRPWISLAVELAGPIARETHPSATRHDWQVRIRYDLHNHGKTPATYVQTHPKLIPLTTGYFSGGVDENGVPQGPVVEGTNVMKEVKQACRSTERHIRDHARPLGMGFGHVIFPGQSSWGSWVLPFPGEETPEPPNYTGHYVIVIGVTYNSTFDNAEDYKTAEAFDLWKRTDDQRLKYTGEPVPVEHLGLIMFPFGAGSLAS